MNGVPMLRVRSLRVRMDSRSRQFLRRGVTVLEVAVACAVLSILIGMTAAALGRVSIMRTRVAHQVFARQQVENIVEQVQAIPYDQLPDRMKAGITLSETAQSVLPNPKLTVEFQAIESSGETAQQIWIELSWPYLSGRPDDRVQASVLRFPSVSQQTPTAVAGESDDA